MTMKTLKISLILLLLLTSLIFIGLWMKERRSEIQVKHHYGYITEEIQVKKPYPYPQPYLVNTPPEIIYEYETDTSVLDSLKLLLQDKEIIISGLEKEIKIHQNFLKQYPYNPKLIEFTLDNNLLSLSLLGIRGSIYKEEYPLYLDHYRYKWVYPSLTREPIRVGDNNKWVFSSYVHVGYSFIPSSPSISLSAELSRNRFRLSSNPSILFNNNNVAYIDLKLGYRIY